MKRPKVSTLKSYQATGKKSSKTIKFVFSLWMWIALKSTQ